MSTAYHAVGYYFAIADLGEPPVADGLRVEISIDCGATFTSIYFKTGSDLSTVGNVSGKWSPNSASDWRNESIDLSSYLGENVQFRFININGYGNSTFIDNVNVSGVLGIAKTDLDRVSMYPNPASNTVVVAFSEVNTNTTTVSLYNSLGQRLVYIPESEMAGKSKAVLNVSNLSTGIYFVRIDSGSQTATKKLIVE